MCQCLQFLGDAEGVAEVLLNLLKRSEEDTLVSYQVAFRIYENENQQFMRDIIRALPDVKSNDDKSFYLIKDFKFKDFEESQNFVNKVGNLAEEENHHPDISFGWGYAKINITTHAIEGLSENDFILAAKIDQANV
mgnify:CR=1 FL=1